MRWGIAAVLLWFACYFPGKAAEESTTSDDAKKYFQEARRLCERDGGTLWGKPLCGPILLVDANSRDVFADQPDREHQLQSRDGLFVGKLPANVNVANTATEWAGVKWTMLMLPLPADSQRRAVLLAHEMWHRLQDELGFPSSSAANKHLDTRDGRYWLQLEWRALAAALTSKGDAQRTAILDAEVFRAQRHTLFSAGAPDERSMEMHEGLAEYTGVRLAASDPRQFAATTNLKEAPEKQTFVRSFAYATGPAYGLLLDEASPAWRKTLRASDDLGALLLTASKAALPSDLAAAAKRRAAVYDDGGALSRKEDRRELDRREREKTYLARLVDGPVMVIPLRKMNMQFDPRNVVPLGEHGMIYPAIRVVDVWGVLEVKSGGALISSDFSKIAVSAPTSPGGQQIKGDGWTLDLDANWLIEPAQRSASYAIRESSQAKP